jgi:hypothetical protein
MLATIVEPNRKTAPMRNVALAATVAATLLVAGANAQTFSTTNSVKCPPDNAQVSVNVGRLTSVTTPRPVTMCPNQNLYIYALASGTQMMTVETRTNDGVVISTSNVTATTLVPSLLFTQTAGTTGMQQVRVSPSTPLTGLNNISLTIVRTPALVR